MEHFADSFRTRKLDIRLLSNVLGGKVLAEDLKGMQTQEAEDC
jgi:hypothetical protein